MIPLLASVASWPGVDEHVVLPFAESAGRSPHPPVIPLEGDALLFAFLCAGLVGGFLLGYLYRALFVEAGGRT